MVQVYHSLRYVSSACFDSDVMAIKNSADDGIFTRVSTFLKWILLPSGNHC